MSPVQLEKVEVHDRCQLVGELPAPGGEFKSQTAYVSVLLSTGVWYRLAITEGGWRLRLERSLEPPSFLGMPTDDWRLMWREFDQGKASIDFVVSVKSADLKPNKQPGDDSIECGDAIYVSVNLRYKVLNLDGVSALKRPYDGLFVGTVSEISMTAC